MKITHDFHIHTHISSCGKTTATLKHYITKAKELGLTKIGISDHMWDPAVPGATTWYKQQSFEHIMLIKEELKNIDTQGVKVLIGCEGEYDRDGEGVAITEEIAEQLDFILVPNSHTNITMPKDLIYPYQKHVDFMLKAFYDIVNSKVAKYITAIPHPFLAVNCPYDNIKLLQLITDDQFKECFTAAANKGIAMEINPCCFANMTLSQIYEHELIRMYTFAKECGCKFTIGSDSHSDTGHNLFYLSYIPTSILGLTENDFHAITK